MADAAVNALTALLNPELLVMLLAGVLAGLVMGVIPGLGGTAAMALLVSFVYQLDPAQALALMVGAVAVVHTSDTITAVLLGAPGSASAAVTVMEGHALARQGQAARALSVAFLSSMVGGLLGAIGLTLSIPIARPLVLAFGSPELFALCVLAISITASLTEGTLLKSLISGMLGVLIGLVGAAPAAPEYRYTFGQLYLTDGIPLVAVAIGLFGLVEIVELIARGGSVASRIPVGSGWLQGVRDFIQHRWLVLRGALIGIWAGVLPGIGATAGTWMAYGHVAATSKEKKKFGKGDVRGIIAPESANNAVEAGDLIPTLLFGIPGSAPAAILMGVLLYYGMQPGPRIITDHLDIVYTIIWSFALANILGAAICFAISPALARLTFVPFRLLAPGLIVLMALGTYQEGGQFGDLFVMLALGLTAWILKQAGYPRAPMLISYVLTPPLERYYWLSVDLYGSSMLTRPGVLVLGALLLATLFFAWRSRRRDVSEAGEVMTAGSEEETSGNRQSRLPHPGFAVAVSGTMFLLFLAALIDALSFAPKAQLLPLLAGLVGVALTAVQLVADVRRLYAPDRHPWTAVEWRQGIGGFLWMASLLLLTWMMGFLVAVALFVPLFLIRVARMRPWKAAIYAGVTVLVVLFLHHMIGIDWPAGWVTVDSLSLLR